jgi:hypothetical protein
LLEAGRVAESVTHGTLNERQARELVPVLRQEDEDAVVEVYAELKAEFGEKLTAEKVRTAVAKRLKPKPPRVVDAEPARAAEPVRAVPAIPMSERDLQRYVLDVAQARGWLVYHTFDSRRSQPGFPDLVMLRAERQVVAELKVGRNEPTAAQEAWLDAFHEAGAQVCVWREGDLDQIAAILR